MDTAVEVQTNLNNVIIKIAQDNSTKWDLSEKELSEKVKKKIRANGIPSHTLLRYLRGESNPTLENANKVLSALQTFDSSIQMSDIF
jgi:hypothetical protein